MFAGWPDTTWDKNIKQSLLSQQYKDLWNMSWMWERDIWNQDSLQIFALSHEVAMLLIR